MSVEVTADARVSVTALFETATVSTPRLFASTVTVNADLSGVCAESRASLKVTVRVAASTAADDGVGGAVSVGVAVASAEGGLLLEPLRASTRTAYSVPSTRPVMTWEVPLTLACDTSAAMSQLSLDCFHCTM